jgi:FNIP Repeat
VCFNTEIDKNVLPDSLTELHFKSYNHRFYPGVLPSSLKILSTGDEWNQQIIPGDLPIGLTELHLCFDISYMHYPYIRGDFNRPILPSALPDTITHLTIGTHFSHKISMDMFPSSLKTLLMLSAWPDYEIDISEWNTCTIEFENGLLVYSACAEEHLKLHGVLDNNYCKVLRLRKSFPSY